jgi:hypothetical protein
MNTTLLNSNPLSVSATTSAQLCEVDPQLFSEKFHARPFLIRHHLASHPLFTLPSLIALSKRLPKEHVEYNSGNLSVNQEYVLTPRNGLSIEETIRRIEECSSWMVLKFVQEDSLYGALLNQCLDEIRHYSEPIEPGMCQREGYIFISSPSSVTPYHIDNEHNFLLQIRGQKTVYQWDPWDRAVLPELELERFYLGGHRNIPYQEDYAKQAYRFDLTPGLGLHFPVNCPHWIQNGPEVSVSFSITFHTPASDRRALAYQANAMLRKWGIGPTPIGQIPWRDYLKVQALRGWRKGTSLVGLASKARTSRY